MKDNVLESANNLKAELESSELVKEYKRLKNIIEHDPEILDLAARLKTSAKLSQDKSDFLSLKSAYENHPLIVNFQAVEAELKDMLEMIKEIIEE